MAARRRVRLRGSASFIGPCSLIFAGPFHKSGPFQAFAWRTIALEGVDRTRERHWHLTRERLVDAPGV
jgi:hypothetical protein